MSREVERARKIIDDCMEYYHRWGRLADSSLPYKNSELLDAMTALAENSDESYLEHRDELNKVKRQLTACQAREAKQKKQIEKLKEEIEDMEYEMKEVDAS